MTPFKALILRCLKNVSQLNTYNSHSHMLITIEKSLSLLLDVKLKPLVDIRLQVMYFSGRRTPT